MNNTGWVMHKIKISDIDPYLLEKQTPPGHTHFMAPFTNRSIGDFEQAVIIKKNALRPGNEEVKYPHGMLEKGPIKKSLNILRIIIMLVLGFFDNL